MRKIAETLTAFPAPGICDAGEAEYAAALVVVKTRKAVAT